MRRDGERQQADRDVFMPEVAERKVGMGVHEHGGGTLVSVAGAESTEFEPFKPGRELPRRPGFKVPG